MSREIKFRGWHTSANRMFSAEEMAADQLTLLTTGSFINVSGASTSQSVIYDREKFIPLQFTGLKDKNGKEIYEGDIIQYKQYTAFRRWWSRTEEIPEIEKAFGDSKVSNTQVSRAPIRFADGAFRLSYEVDGYTIARGEKVKSGHTTHADYEDKWWDFEVIGNIYENPELLKL